MLIRTELQQVLGQYLSPPQPYTSFLALPKSGSLLVTENTAVIRKLVSVIDQVDIPPAEVVSEFIKLERADASKVVDLLNQIFEKGNQPGGAQPPGMPPNVGVRGVRYQPNPAKSRERSGRVNRADRGIDRGGQDQDHGRCAHEPDPRCHAPDQHAVYPQIDRGVRCQRRVCQAGHAVS